MFMYFFAFFTPSHQNFNYLCTPTDDGFIPKVTVNPDFSFGAVRKAVAEIKERLEEFGREELLKISKTGPSDFPRLDSTLFVPSFFSS